MTNDLVRNELLKAKKEISTLIKTLEALVK